MKRYIYLISPPKIRGDKFYKELHKVLKTNKVRYFQLRLKKISDRNLLNISKKIKKIVKKNNVKFLINDNPLIAKMTLGCLKESVPDEVPGIAFLSGGQTEIEATQNLNEINKINNTSFIMSFSYGRALQQSALKNWAKDIKDTNNTQKIFNHRSKMNGLSTSAKWSMDLENQITV